MFVYAALRRQERAQALRDMNRRLPDEVRARADELQEAHAALLRKESLAVLGRLTATVSHELRNPLGTIDTSVSTSSRLLEHGDGLTASNLATINQALRRVQRLEIRVRDTGGGIPPELREQIFEPLFSARAFGFGLGLPFVKQVVEQQHGGSLELVDTSVGPSCSSGCHCPRKGCARM